MGRRTKLALVAFGSVAAVALGAGVVAVRQWAFEAAGVDTSGGMFAFGDALTFFVATGVFLLAPAWLLFATMREAAGFQSLVTFAAVAWSAVVPVTLVVSLLAESRSPLAALASGVLVLRLVVAPPSFVGIGVAWWIWRGSAVARRRLMWALGFEATGLVAIAVFLVQVAIDRMR